MFRRKQTPGKPPIPSAPPSLRLPHYLRWRGTGHLAGIRWGALSLVSLYLSVISGIIVALQYNLADPFYSVAAIDLLVPYGAFFRSLHFYTSQAFFLFGCMHLVFTYDKSEAYTTRDWVMLVFSMVAGLLLLFTGYILRADSTGFSAGMIAESIMLTIPVFGPSLNTMFFAITEWGMQRVYVHHVITLDALWLVLAWHHLRRYQVKVSDHIPLLTFSVVFCLLIAAPIEPEKLGTTYIAGPWFFLGLQELLRYLSPLLAGVVFPAMFLVLLLLAKKGGRWTSLLLPAISGWLVIYTLLTLVAWLR